MSEGPGINSSEVERDLKTLADLIRDGKLWSVDPPTLTRLLNALCIARTGDTTNALHIVQGLVVNHEQMARHITKLDASNRRVQRWVIALAVAALVAAGVQAGVALAFYFGHPSISKSYDKKAPNGAVQGDSYKSNTSNKVDPTKPTTPPAKK